MIISFQLYKNDNAPRHSHWKPVLIAISVTIVAVTSKMHVRSQDEVDADAITLAILLAMTSPNALMPATPLPAATRRDPLSSSNFAAAPNTTNPTAIPSGQCLDTLEQGVATLKQSAAALAQSVAALAQSVAALEQSVTVFNAETLAEVKLINTPEIAEQDVHEEALPGIAAPSACMERDMAALKEDIHEALDGFEETIKREITKRNHDEEALLGQRMESRMATLDNRMDGRMGAMERGIRELVAEVKKISKPEIAKPNPPLEQRMESRMTAMERGMGEVLTEVKKMSQPQIAKQNRHNDAIFTIAPEILELVAYSLPFSLLLSVIHVVGGVAAGVQFSLLELVVVAARALAASELALVAAVVVTSAGW